jgi:hypothetical protein
LVAPPWTVYLADGKHLIHEATLDAISTVERKSAPPPWTKSRYAEQLT